MKKVISILTVFVLLFSCVSIAASAVDNSLVLENPTRTSEKEAIRFDPTTKITVPEKKVTSSGGLIRQFNSDNNADTFFTFYSQLTNNQKTLYNAIKANPFNLTFTINLTDNINGYGTVVDNTITFDDDLYSQIYDVIIHSQIAVGEDYPELFWLIFYGCNYGASSDGWSCSPYSGNRYSVTISAITVQFQLILKDSNGNDYSPYKTMTEVQTNYNQVMTFVNNFHAKGFTRYDKIKYINDILCENITYDLNASYAHEPTGALISPYHAVCEGYAEAFKLLCNKEGIPCVTVVGTTPDPTPEDPDRTGGHAWNFVRMEDGLWYAVDSTWNDNVSNTVYDYFMVGGDSHCYSERGDTNTFTQSHTATGSRLTDNSVIFTYPTINSASYSPMTLAFASTGSVSKSKSMVYIKSGTTVNNMFYGPSGYDRSSTGNATNSTLTITKDGSTVATYTVVMRGDVDCNGVANNVDYQKVKNLSVDIGSTNNAAEFEAADINGDGAIDGFDTMYLDRMLYGIKDF